MRCAHRVTYATGSTLRVPWPEALTYATSYGPRSGLYQPSYQWQSHWLSVVGRLV